MGENFQLEQLFSVEKEYRHCISVLKSTGILINLPKSHRIGVFGIDGKEYPVPTKKQVVEIFKSNRELAWNKILQGFAHLELTPFAIPISILIDRTKIAIIKHATERKIFQTRHFPSYPLIIVPINVEKQIWIWDTLKTVMETKNLVYFPIEYSIDHYGYFKFEIIKNPRICAVPGWSIGLVENLSIMPKQGQGKTIGGRKQLEIGFSPREYLETLQDQTYQGESGKTFEDFIINFLTRLETTNEISNDRYDDNALWLLGQYIKCQKCLRTDLIPSVWWHRSYGRLRMDAHRPGNKTCTESWGGSTVVRLIGA